MKCTPHNDVNVTYGKFITRAPIQKKVQSVVVYYGDYTFPEMVWYLLVTNKKIKEKI